VVVGMTLSNVVFYFIIVTAGATLFRAGHRDIETTRQAAEALLPLAGPAAYLLFGVGLIGSGLLAIPVLAGSASFAIAELLKWRAGLDEPFHRAKRFYYVFACAVGVGVALDLIKASPIRMMFLSSLVNGLAAPPLLVVIMLVANNRRVMGDRTNTPLLNVFGWGATVLMAAAAVGLLAMG
jgi:Mn2+/Fe2+ NRAMP family transporter